MASQNCSWCHLWTLSVVWFWAPFEGNTWGCPCLPPRVIELLCYLGSCWRHSTAASPPACNQLNSGRRQNCKCCPCERCSCCLVYQWVLTYDRYPVVSHCKLCFLCIFILLSVGWWKKCWRAWLALWELPRTYWLVSVQLCGKNTRRRKSFVSKEGLTSSYSIFIYYLSYFRVSFVIFVFRLLVQS